MSTQSRIAYFFVSLLLHLIIGMLIFFPPYFELSSQPEKRKPIVVDVVELPPSLKPTKERPRKPTAYSDRTVKVEKEKVPEERPSATRRKKAVAPSVKRAEKRRAIEEKRASEKKPQKAEEKKPIKKVEKKRAKRVLPEKKPTTRPSEGERKPAPEPTKVKPERRQEGPVALFPTERRLQELSERYQKAPPKKERGKVLSLNTSELKYSKYLLDMKRRIEFYWEYPLSSIRNGEQGRLLIDFVITRDGSVKDIRIVKSSNYPALDDAAVTAIRLASPFNPFPKDFTIEEVRVHATFEYQLIFTRPLR